MNNFFYNVSFPNLGIHLKINPLAFQAGPFTVYWYGVILAVGFVLAYLYANKRATDFSIKKSALPDLVTIGFVCAVITARIYYVIFYPGDFYIKNPAKIFNISEGGIAIYGGVIGAVIGLYIAAKIKKLNYKALFDLMSLGLLIGQCIGRWGNFTNQEAFGSPTNLPWGMMSENTSKITVHPCFLYESLGCLIIFIILHIYSKQKSKIDGQIFLMYLLFYGILRAIIEGLRTDSLIIPGTALRVSQILAIGLVIISIYGLIINNKQAELLRTKIINFK